MDQYYLKKLTVPIPRNGGDSRQVALVNLSDDTHLIAALIGRFQTANDLWLYLYADGTFRMILPNGENLQGTYAFRNELIVFTFTDKTVAEPELDKEGNSVYSITTESGFSIEFVLTKDFTEKVKTALEDMKA